GRVRGSVTMVQIWGALLAATLGVLVLQSLARRLFPGAAVSPSRILALNGLIFLFWRDHFDFPLSDFPALLLTCAALLALLGGSSLGNLLAGIGFGLAANARPEYLPALFFPIVLPALLPLPPWDPRARGAATGPVAVGAFIALLPQVLINHRHHDTWSPLIAGGRDIALVQLTDGMLAQKYETFVGSKRDYPRPEVFYLDPATRHVLAREHVSEITSYG